MAKRSDIRYIQFYVDGTAARKLEPAAPVKEAKTVRMPPVRKQKYKRIYIDPVATFGIIVAVCMLVMMLVGVAQLKAAKHEAAVMEWYVTKLSYDNEDLSGRYAEKYNLYDIEQKALALGMVPASQARQTPIDISLPPAEEEPISLWEQVGTFLTSLFA